MDLSLLKIVELKHFFVFSQAVIARCDHTFSVVFWFAEKDFLLEHNYLIFNNLCPCVLQRIN